MTTKDEVRSTVEALHTERALKLALEALEGLADYRYTERVKQALSALRVALSSKSEALHVTLAESALERMAENERELGLDYMEPAQVDPCIDGSCSCCWTHLDEQPAPATEVREQQVPVYVRDDENVSYMFTATPRLEQMDQEPVAKVCHDLDGHIGWNPKLTQLPDEGTLLYTSPPAPKPWVGLTTDDRKQLLHDHHPDIDPVAFFEATEAKLKEKNA